LPFQLKELNEQLSLLSLYKLTADSTIAQQDSMIRSKDGTIVDLFSVIDMKDQIIVNNEITIQNMNTINSNNKKRLRNVIIYSVLGGAAGGALFTAILMR